MEIEFETEALASIEVFVPGGDGMDDKVGLLIETHGSCVETMLTKQEVRKLRDALRQVRSA